MKKMEYFVLLTPHKSDPHSEEMSHKLIDLFCTTHFCRALTVRRFSLHQNCTAQRWQQKMSDLH